MKKTLWVTMCIPVEVEEEADIPLAQTALDEGWERLSAADGPPEGLLEYVTEEKPEVHGSLIAEKAA